MPRKPKYPIIEYTKLRSRGADGMCFEDGRILIDPRLSPLRRLEVTCHEYMHHLDFLRSEEQVTKEAKMLSTFLWRNGYRHVDLEK
jgi:hypothetical protein